MKNGYLVRTAGFDATMLALGNALFPQRIGVHEAEEYLNNRTSQSENDFRIEIEKMKERAAVSEKERQEQNRMTAWDYWRQGNQYCDMRQYEDAVKIYSSVIDMQSNIAQFYNSRGVAYCHLEKYDKALNDCNRAILLNSQVAELYVNRGLVYSELGDYDKAVCDLEKAIALDPDVANPYKHYGVICRKKEEYEKAVEFLAKAKTDEMTAAKL